MGCVWLCVFCTYQCCCIKLRHLDGSSHKVRRFIYPLSSALFFSYLNIIELYPLLVDTYRINKLWVIIFRWMWSLLMLVYRFDINYILSCTHGQIYFKNNRSVARAKHNHILNYTLFTNFFIIYFSVSSRLPGKQWKIYPVLIHANQSRAKNELIWVHVYSQVGDDQRMSCPLLGMMYVQSAFQTKYNKSRSRFPRFMCWELFALRSAESEMRKYMMGDL